MDKKILGVDVGSVWAWSFYDNGFAEHEEHKSDLVGYGNKIREVLQLYKPDVVVTARPTRFHAVIASQSKKLGILEYYCRKADIEYKEYIDSHCKKIVLNNGRANKEDVISFFNEPSEHVADAKMFIQTYLIET